MKQALILNAVDARIGGLLIMGHRGTAKSTAVRALADLLPHISTVSGCAYRCDPAIEASLCADCAEALTPDAKLPSQKSPVAVVELPLGATEDRVSGTIDIEQALRSGIKRFEPGLLARANRGFLYIDEVNLLEDHLVDLLLDVAATGVNRVEREGISVQHPARFVLIGSGNPEEGELRPQLLDRFGLYVEVPTERDLDRRVEIVERREEFDADPQEFQSRMAEAQEQLRRNIVRARKNVAGVRVERELLRSIARLCSELNVDGHRGELTITRAARALAALAGRKKVSEVDVRRVAVMALRHRLRRDALEETAGPERIEQAVEEVFSGGARAGSRHLDSAAPQFRDRASEREADQAKKPKSAANIAGGNGSGGRRERGESPEGDRPGSHHSEVHQRSSSSSQETKLKLGLQKSPSGRQAGKSRQGLTSNRQPGGGIGAYHHDRGKFTRSVSLPTRSGRIALEASLRAAAVDSRFNSSAEGRKIPGEALRYKLFKRKRGRLFIFAIDLSGSMALQRINRAREVILGLLRESYIDRDSVAIIGFRGATAEIMLPPSKSILRARRVLDALPMGGGTPLSAGLGRSLELAKRVRGSVGEVTLLLFTDGGANVPFRETGALNRSQRQQIIAKEVTWLGVELLKSGIITVVLDTQSRHRATDDTHRIAEYLGARFVKL